MYKLCVFAGTADGRQLVERLAGQAEILACAATEYGGELLEEIPGVEVSAQRLDENQMEELFRQRQFDCVIDATHPYAPIVTENIRSACEKTDTSYLRLLRDGGLPEGCLFADSTAQAVEMLKTLPGNILLTTGSKELAAYAALPDYAQRVYARVLPVEASVAACRETGLPAAHIYAVQGPFPEELNVAMLHACNAQILVTKQTGSKGGFFEKVSAAQKAGVTLLVIGRPESAPGVSFGEAVRLLQQRFDFRMTPQVTVVGIGPGNYENMTIRADTALRACDAIVGYPVYVDLVRDRYPGKELHSTPMTREAERCQLALELARSGKTVAMVCSGDSGIYGMAALVYELRGEAQEPEIQVVPGLTAACSAAAVLGAPLTHDFAVISLSDRLTPWETIEKRLDCAAAADLTIALYNPASHGRPDHLKRACDILLRRLPGERLCGIVRNIGREGQSSRILTLAELREAEVDMFCTVLIGSAAVKTVAGQLVTPRGYRNV